MLFDSSDEKTQEGWFLPMNTDHNFAVYVNCPLRIVYFYNVR